MISHASNAQFNGRFSYFYIHFSHKLPIQMAIDPMNSIENIITDEYWIECFYASLLVCDQANHLHMICFFHHFFVLLHLLFISFALSQRYINENHMYLESKCRMNYFTIVSTDLFNAKLAFIWIMSHITFILSVWEQWLIFHILDVYNYINRF